MKLPAPKLPAPVTRLPSHATILSLPSRPQSQSLPRALGRDQHFPQSGQRASFHCHRMQADVLSSSTSSLPSSGLIVDDLLLSVQAEHLVDVHFGPPIHALIISTHSASQTRWRLQTHSRGRAGLPAVNRGHSASHLSTRLPPTLRVLCGNQGRCRTSDPGGAEGS
jgi:hypothetical protein